MGGVEDVVVEPLGGFGWEVEGVGGFEFGVYGGGFFGAGG